MERKKVKFPARPVSERTLNPLELEEYKALSAKKLHFALAGDTLPIEEYTRWSALLHLCLKRLHSESL